MPLSALLIGPARPLYWRISHLAASVRGISQQGIIRVFKRSAEESTLVAPPSLLLAIADTYVDVAASSGEQDCVDKVPVSLYKEDENTQAVWVQTMALSCGMQVELGTFLAFYSAYLLLIKEELHRGSRAYDL